MRPGLEVGMSDSVQLPPAAETAKPERHWLPWVHRNGRAAASAGVAGNVYFADLVHAHYEWRQAVEDKLPADELKAEYARQLVQFQAKYGEIVDAYWCLHERSAVALTEKRQRKLLWLKPRIQFHRVTDWATRDKPEIAAGLHKCDELGIRAMHVLWGMRKRIALQMVTASAGHLLSLADPKITDAQAADIRERELDAKKGMLKRTEDYYCDAANGQAQMIYFFGMAIVAMAIGAFALVAGLIANVPNIDDRAFFGAILAGALGALVSVVARVNSGRFDLEYDVGFTYPFFLGGLRPLMGAIFGLAVFFAIESGLLTIPKIAADDEFAGIILLAFVAGFSERWAKDTLAVAAGDPPKKAPAKEAA
jgi:hypothetical protein